MTIPTVKKALAANASALLSPASSRKMVLMPQMNDEARVENRVRARSVRSTARAGSLRSAPAAIGRLYPAGMDPARCSVSEHNDRDSRQGHQIRPDSWLSPSGAGPSGGRDRE